MRWFAVVPAGEADSLGDIPLPDSQLLLIADAADAPRLAASRPDAFLLTRAADGPALDALRPFSRRILVLDAALSPLHLVLRVQNLFLRMLLWENDLDRIVANGGTLQGLLDASVPMLENFIFMSDNSFSVIARTAAVEPPDELHRTIIGNGCLTPGTIAEKRFRLPEKTFYTRPASELTPYDRVSYPIHLQHLYFGSISMACNARPDTAGLRDLFRILIRHVRTVCERLWSAQTVLDTPSYFFFSKLLRHETMSAEYLAAQREADQLPDPGHFKAIVFDVDPSIAPDAAYRTISAATGLNEGRVRCFPYEDAVFALCFSPGADGSLSHRKTLDEVHRHIFEPLGVECGVSSVFTDLADLDLAYRQAKVALAFRGSIAREMDADGSPQPRGAYLFEDALLYYLVDPTGADERFIRFAFGTSIVSILWQEDQRNGTDHLAILWFYLQSERNATATAQKLHMHRNTVLYHIEKIQQRFDFDMGIKAARDWLLICFKAFFAAQSRESLGPGGRGAA